jgi:DHA1 family bicyclomycin/chloramphenicol resistance-like MFS transporter
MTPPDRTAPPAAPPSAGSDLGRGRLLLLTVVVGMTAALPAVSLDSFLASIPNIAEGLHTSASAISFSIAALMLGNAIGQLIHGPLSDRFGRKPIAIGLLAVFGAAALAAAVAPNVEVLIACRFVQGLAQAGGRVLAVAVARDLFERERLGKMMAEILMVTSIVTIFNPIIGGQIAQYLPWPSAFVFMAGYAAACIVLAALFQPETIREKDPAAINPVRLASNFLTIAANADFRRYAACSAIGMSGFGAFAAGASPVLIGAQGLEPATFGYFYTAVTLSYFAGNWTCGRLVGRLHLDGMIAFGAVFVAIGGLSMAGLALAGLRWAGVVHPLAVVLPMGVYVFGMASVIAQGSAGAVQPFAANAGAASTLLGFAQNGMIAIVVTVVSLLPHTSALPMGTALAMIGLAVGAVYLFAIRPAGRREA